jgi:hypothetical protein
MQPPDSTRSSHTASLPWDRQQTVAHLDAFEAVRHHSSIRGFARERRIPRSTLQDWIARKMSIDASPAVRDFFESPDGLAVLHRLVGAAHLVFSQIGPCGIRLVTLFLELSRLDRFVASCFGSQHKVASDVEQAIASFGDEQRRHLGATMPKRSITVAQDETFHPEPCLVAIEPVSGFILLEQYAEHRDATTWSEAMRAALEGLSVEVVQATSDEAKGLLRHAREGLGAHHSPDLFHVQREIGTGTSQALRSQTRAATTDAERSEAALDETRRARERFDDPTRQRGPGRRPNFERRTKEAEQALVAARAEVEAAAERQQRMRDAVVGLGSDSHPYDLETGRLRTREELEGAMARRFVAMDDVASEADLSERATAHLDKAWRVVDGMVATLGFVHTQARRRVEELGLGPELEGKVLDELVGAEYLKRAARKAPKAERRRAIETVSERLRSAWEATAEVAQLSREQRERIEHAAAESAELFQRSSSCVEGRNGQLALRHHGLRGLSVRKLKVLTVVHNYFIKRANGTTAAERFFRAKPGDLFDWVLDHIDVPARPAKSRARSPLQAAS